MSDPNNILPVDPLGEQKGKLSEDKLMAWLEGKLSAAEQHEVEQWIAAEGMEGDAIEGLRELKPDETRHTVNKLNHELKKAIVNKKRKRRPLKNDQFSWIAIAIILLLVVLAYIVIKRSL